MSAPPPYSPPGSTGNDGETRDTHALTDPVRDTSSATSTASSASSASTILPPYPPSRDRAAPSRSDEPRSVPPIAGALQRLRNPGDSGTSNATSSGTRERLRQMEIERDDLRRAMQQERTINDRLKREAGLTGLSAAEARLRVLELKREAQAAAQMKRTPNEGMFKAACATDLLFLMDTTSSMGPFIAAAKEQVKKIMQDITETFYNEAEVRIAVVSYKDHCDKNHIQFIDFTTDVEKVRGFIDKLKARGGGDAPEDVLGGIQQAINASWKNQTRCIIHIADAPPHGNIFHSWAEKSDDYYTPGSEPHKLQYQPLLKQMIGLNLNYALLRILSATDKMAYVFLQEYAAASADCKLLKSNPHYREALKANSGPRSSVLGASSKGTAKGGLLFEEAELGTTYSALRHLVVKSVTSSASRTAVRMSESSSRTGEKGTKTAQMSHLDAIGEAEDDEFNEKQSEAILEDVEKKWSDQNWFEDKLVVEGFSPDTVIHRSGTLNDMMAHDDNIKLSVMELNVHKRRMPFAQGALRLAYCAKTTHSTNPYVVKSFKRGGKRLAHLAEDMRCQALCKAFALEFNALTDDKHSIDFIVTSCLKGKSGDSGTDYISLEPFIEGDYVKYNNNCSYVNEDNPDDEFNKAAQAFSHFTYERSWGSFLVCDLQGVGHVLTDPAIHTLDPERFKLADTNLGREGFKFFFATHVCNEICTQLELKSKASMISSEKASFREWWPTIDSTACCSNKLCGKIIQVTNANKSEEFPGCNWCDTCWPQLEATKEKVICVAPGTHHEFDVSRFYWESQGRVAPRKCEGHRERDETVARTAVMGGNFFGRLRGATKKKSISGKAW
ncbi:hypothetical protein BKA60DRAFT_555652 [Fusarium oxysporum]|uniref:Alpha-protein kinase vwkA n=2 Tax=Fusarium oxysporum TaxID=5507 RepID=A0A420P123_FUSOX|nr:hypothetical protein BKA60DRAFT_555652 [Fusarium oxysporum]RKK86222.1 hypothetical protein BFJ69_g1175 [Fusarium oxysporum]